MKKTNFFNVVILFAVILVGMSACSNSSDDATSINNQSKPDNKSESTDDSLQPNDSSTDNIVKSDISGKNHSDRTSIENGNALVEDSNRDSSNTDKKGLPDTTKETKENENIQEGNAQNTVTKIKGRRIEFVEKLDNIQRKLDALPEKEDSDKGVTNAMKNYYGISYETYDEALNEIYALLKEELSLEAMNELKTEQIKWIEQKEETANEARKEYEGGTFEDVAYYISLYESTKEKCYELVNEYMTD